MQNQNLDAFQERMKRISKQEGGGRALIAGEGDVSQTQVSANSIKKSRHKPASESLVLAVPKWAMAVVLGGLAVLVGRLLGYHVLGQFLAGGDMMMMVMRQVGELAAAIGLLVAAATFIGFRGGIAKMAMIAGFVGMMLGESEIAKQAPYAWEMMFSAEYAANVLGPNGSMGDNLRTIATVLQGV